IKIIPQINAKQAAAFGSNTNTPVDIITRVIQIKHIPASQLVPILRPLVPQYGHLAAYVPANSLIISDRAANVKRIRRIVARIDQAGMDHVETIALEHANAQEVVRVIKNLKTSKQQGSGAV